MFRKEEYYFIQNDSNKYLCIELFRGDLKYTYFLSFENSKEAENFIKKNFSKAEISEKTIFIKAKSIMKFLIFKLDKESYDLFDCTWKRKSIRFSVKRKAIN